MVDKLALIPGMDFFSPKKGAMTITAPFQFI